MGNTWALLQLLQLLQMRSLLALPDKASLDRMRSQCRQAVRAKMDLQLIVDSSYSIGRELLANLMAKIERDINDHFNINDGAATRVALFKYSGEDAMIKEFGLKTYSDRYALLDEMKAIKFTPGLSYTGKAMEEALKSFTEETRGENTVKVCVVFTDGHADDIGKIPAASRAWQHEGVTVFAVGVGNDVDREGLRIIAGSESRVRPDNFRGMDWEQKSVFDQMCEDPNIKCCMDDPAAFVKPEILVTGICKDNRKLPCCDETWRVYEHNIKIGPWERAMQYKGVKYPDCAEDGYFVPFRECVDDRHGDGAGYLCYCYGRDGKQNNADEHFHIFKDIPTKAEMDKLEKCPP